ncbi:hypothetical protein ABIB40_001824 [Pedobacter sp. UYP30]|uniref:THUMP-like domain-containing protein n=1 Tax=Pedobacter sp. UYP30 TaxID=1756400 RepID=UPI003399C708
MNKAILQPDVQDFITKNLTADAAKIALAKSPFLNASSAELAAQILAKKKSEKKLFTWFNTPNIYYPTSLCIEQTSSEVTAKHKAKIAPGETLLDITGGFGVDAYYFSQQNKKVVHCEMIEDLSSIASHNAKQLGAYNIVFLNTDGLVFLKQESTRWDTIYADPARRGNTGKVFKLADCTPNIPLNLETLLAKANRVMLKTSPLLDIDAGLGELKHVKEVHVISIKNECKELLWILEPGFSGELKITATTLNDQTKSFSFYKADLKHVNTFAENVFTGLFLYEPDTAILKAGAQDSIALRFNLTKLHANTQLFVSEKREADFPGRIFEITKVMDTKEIKKKPDLRGNVVVRNYPAKAKELVKKYVIKPVKEQFLIFCKTSDEKNIVIEAKIIQYY